ncbi:MAG: hypothetical protein LBJ16_01920 [Holosporaceae bacterium]|jgi:NADH-quinone oxidoreductase subunit L|nr:hypothetical protein [Holosporaceae bacterium]
MGYIVITQFLILVIAIFLHFKNYLEASRRYIPMGLLTTALQSLWLWVMHLKNPYTSNTHLYDLFTVGKASCSLGLLSDALSITGACLISIIAAMAGFYTVGYARKNSSILLVYISALALISTIFSAAYNLLQMYIAFESMAVLLHFAQQSGKEAGPPTKHPVESVFPPHKIADVGFFLAMGMTLYTFGSLNFDDINQASIGNDARLGSMELISAFLLAHVFISHLAGWIKNFLKTSENIPISALVLSCSTPIVYIFPLIRLQTIFECSEAVQNSIIISGLAFAVCFAIKATFSNKINNILAYSSCSQMGLMFMACGFSAYGAGILLLITHAFSKSLLTFISGSVIYALSGENNFHRIGGLFELLPKTYAVFVAATVSIICFPLMSSYYANRALLVEIANSDQRLYWLALMAIVATSTLTSIYMCRLVYKIFHGQRNMDETTLAYLNESDKYMGNVCYVSLFLSIFSGVIFYHAAYADEIWRYVFAFTEVEDRYASVPLMFLNSLGIACALLVCRAVKRPAIYGKLKLRLQKFPDIQEIGRMLIRYSGNLINEKIRVPFGSGSGGGNFWHDGFAILFTSSPAFGLVSMTLLAFLYLALRT